MSRERCGSQFVRFEEVRRNAIKRISAGQPLVDGVLGYDDTVLPQLENALLAGHDVIFLGERGQAKTRIIRRLTGLLDEWIPIVAGSEILDDPYHPVSRHARDLIEHNGDETPVLGQDQGMRAVLQGFPLISTDNAD